MVTEARKRFPGLPVYLLGHSMGGLVVLDYTLLHPEYIAGVIALSPALKVASGIKGVFLPLMLKIAPNLALNNGLSVSGLSRNEEVIEAYQQDELVHEKVTPRLAQYILSAGERVRRHAKSWQVPILLLYAGDDQLVKPQGSTEFARIAPQDVLTVRCFEDAYHELHHEPDTTEFYQALEGWLLSRHDINT